MPTEPLVIRALNDFKQRLAAMEAVQQREMVQRWLAVEDALRGAMDALAQDIAQRLASGEVISRNKLYRMERYRVLIGQARQELAKYTDYAVPSVTRLQSIYAQLGIDDAATAIQLTFEEQGQINATFGRLHIDAVNDMIGRASDGSPLRALFQASYPDAVEGLTQAIIDNMALGKNPRVLARQMADGFGVGLQRAMVIARDQQLRAYRSANDAEYAASGVVTGKRRLAAKDGRTCLACLAQDGEPVEGDMFDHPQGRCVAVPYVQGLPPVEWQRGEDWFAELPEAQQREMMGDKRFEAWKAGKFQFSDLARITHNETWGEGLRVPSLSELTGEKPQTPITVEAPQWRASMSRKDAEVWASESKLKQTFYHGTGITETGQVTPPDELRRRIESIMTEGFKLNTTANGRMLGDGVYLTPSTRQVSRYGTVLETKVNVSNPFITTQGEWSTQYGRIVRQMKKEGLKLSPTERIKWWADKNGYDAIFITDALQQVVVFDPYKITVIGG